MSFPSRRRLLVSCAIVAALAAGVLPTGAQAAAAVSFRITGGGFGHLIGMSQYGAKGQADHGRNFREILTYYYSGTSVSAAAMPPEVRVGVMWNSGEIQVTGDGPFEFHYGSPGGELLATGASGQTWRVNTDGSGNFVLRRPDGSAAARRAGGSTALFVTYGHRGTLLRLPQTGFRYKYGVLELNSYRSSSWMLRGIIAGMNMQQYLYGLGEVPSSWPREVLRAQAVAGRTYAAEKISRLGQTRAPCNCAMFASTLDQAYVGYEKEASSTFGPIWRGAVDDTNSLAVLYGGKPIEAYYFSSSGGHTEHSENVFSSSRPYLRGRPDPWDVVSPHHSWTVTLSYQDLQNRLNANSSTRVGILSGIRTLSPYGVSGAVLRPIDSNSGGVRITGSGGTKHVSGATLRSVLGLKSSRFRIARTGLHPDGTLVKGSGPGVYRIESGRLRPLPGMSVLSTWGTTSEIVGVSNASLLQYATPHAGFRDGTLIQVSGEPAVFIISDGRRRPFSSAVVFEGLGYEWGDIVKVSRSETGIHPVGQPVQATSKHPNGTLLKGSGAAVYWLEDGHRRGIPSMRIFSTWFDTDEIVEVSDAVLGSYPTGRRLGYRSGILMLTAEGTVWIVSRGTRRAFTSAAVFTGLGYSFGNVRKVSSEEARLHRVGPNVSSTSQVNPWGTLASGSIPIRYLIERGVRYSMLSDKVFSSWNYSLAEIARPSDAKMAGYRTNNPPRGFRNGSLVGAPSGTVYLISYGRRLAFSSASVFLGLGYSFSGVKPASWAEVRVHPAGSNISSTKSHPDGTLVKGSSAAIWWLLDGRRRPFPSIEVFRSWRMSTRQVVTISDSRLRSYPAGGAVGFRDGALIGTPDGAVWAISNRRRRPFTSAGAFLSLGYSFSNVRWVSFAEANLHSAGEPIS